MPFTLIWWLPASSSKWWKMSTLQRYNFKYFIQRTVEKSINFNKEDDVHITLLFFQLSMLEYEFEANESGIILKLEGLNDKLARLLETILSSFSRFESRLTDDLFRVVREQVSVLDILFSHITYSRFSMTSINTK